MKVFSLLFLLIVCAGCKQANQSTTKNWTTNLRSVQLPLQGQCDNDMALMDTDLLKTTVNGIPEDYKYATLIGVKKGYNVVLLVNTLADYQLHMLATVAENGSVTDTLSLYKTNCSEDAFYKGKAFYSIDKDFKIVLKGRSESYKRNEDGNVIQESINNKTYSKSFVVNVKGTFVPLE